MVDLAQTLTLVGTLYDAAISGRGWPQALQDTASLVGGRAAFLHWSSGRSEGDLLASAHSTPELAPQGVRLYLGLEALLAYEQTLPVGAVFAASEVVPPQVLVHTPFFEEWGPQDCLS